MVLYEYRCPNCDKTAEDITKNKTIQCSCKGEKSPFMKRVYGFGGVAFKGSGFYKTDKGK